MSNPVLVVDDDPDFVELVQALLRNLHTVEGCTDSKLALERIHQTKPVLVFLDLHMPPPTGWDILQALRREPAYASLPVLVVSAAGSEAEALEADLRDQATGPVEILPKPFEIEDLLAKVRALTRWRLPSSLGDSFSAEASSRVGSAS